MKAITPVNIWHEGSLKSASKLDAFSSYDDLKNLGYATFTYKLLEEIVQTVETVVVPEVITEPVPAVEEIVQPVETVVVPEVVTEPVPPIVFRNIIASGVVLMGGQDYIDWDNSNEQAYEFIANKLNLQLVEEQA